MPQTENNSWNNWQTTKIFFFISFFLIDLLIIFSLLSCWLFRLSISFLIFGDFSLTPTSFYFNSTYSLQVFVWLRSWNLSWGSHLWIEPFCLLYLLFFFELISFIFAFFLYSFAWFFHYFIFFSSFYNYSYLLYFWHDTTATYMIHTIYQLEPFFHIIITNTKLDRGEKCSFQSIFNAMISCPEIAVTTKRWKHLEGERKREDREERL